MKWYRYDIHTTTKDADEIGGILTELGVAGYEITDHVPLTKQEEAQMYTDIPADLGVDDGKSTLTFYTGADTATPDEADYYSTGSSLRDAQLKKETADTSIIEPEALIAQLKECIAASPFLAEMPEITWCLQDDSLWKDKWKESFQPFYVADDILIKPSWEPVPDNAKKDDIIIEIDPGSAFGTGTHETTRLCLLALRRHIHDNTTILDAGCGSGILAICALLCGATSAFCLDVDANAVRATLENAQKNGISPERLRAVRANILENKTALKKECDAGFDIAVANILADVIIPLSDHIGEFLKPGGLFISSGILAQKADEVEQALIRNQFTILDRQTLGDWVCFTAKQQTIS